MLGVANTARVITDRRADHDGGVPVLRANPNPTVKLIGFGMAVAVLIDSTVVRMVLVPAIMELFGARAWWFPGWLSWLPHLDIEGPSPDDPSAGPGTGDSGPADDTAVQDGDAGSGDAGSGDRELVSPV